MPPKDPVAWNDSFQMTHFIIMWSSIERSLDPITQVFADEMIRRKGLRAYGISAVKRKASSLASPFDNVRLLAPANFDANADAA